MEKIKQTANEMPKAKDKYLPLMSKEKTEKASAFRKSFPQCSKTPLVELNHMAAYLGLDDFLVKDESHRFSLNTFKVLGGSFVTANYTVGKLKKDVSELTCDELASDQLRSVFGQTTLLTATGGNHGRGVAWTANKLSQKPVILMPRGSTQTRKENIEKGSATVTTEEINCDECVRMANRIAEGTEDGVTTQDTAWDRYEKIPTWIMQGHETVTLGASQQLRKFGSEQPSHAFVQVGVGSLAGVVIGYFANAFPENPSVTVMVEAQATDCLYRSTVKKDGKIRLIDGDLQTIMAGPACGESNTISFDILRNHISFLVSMSDWVFEKEMRILGAPSKGDPQAVSGESGVIAMGLVTTVMQNSGHQGLHETLQLGETSSVLMFSTEGDTDPDNHKKILWR